MPLPSWFCHSSFVHFNVQMVALASLYGFFFGFILHGHNYFPFWKNCYVLVCTGMPFKKNQCLLKKKSVHAFLGKLTSSVATRFGDNRSMSKKSLFDKLSCTLMKHIARSISSRFPEHFVS